MKVRSDFVTNSSSSSFIIARKPELTKKQKKVILDFVTEQMLGYEIIHSEEELKEYFDNYGIDEESVNYQAALRHFKTGYLVSTRRIDFDRDNTDLYTNLWELLEQSDPKDFIGIDTF